MPLVFRAPSDPAVGLDCLWPHGCSGRRRPRPPARLGPHFVRRRASKPARALRTLRRPPHQWGWVAVVWFGASSRSPARPRHRPRAPQPGPPDPPAPSTPVGLGRCCLVRRVVTKPGQALPLPGPVDQVGRLSETVIAFACWYLCGSETCIAFAGAKWAYPVHFSGAVVMSVSAVPCWG